MWFFYFVGGEGERINYFRIKSLFVIRYLYVLIDLNSICKLNVRYLDLAYHRRRVKNFLFEFMDTEMRLTEQINSSFFLYSFLYFKMHAYLYVCLIRPDKNAMCLHSLLKANHFIELNCRFFYIFYDEFLEIGVTYSGRSLRQRVHRNM